MSLELARSLQLTNDPQSPNIYMAGLLGSQCLSVAKHSVVVDGMGRALS